MAKPPYTVDRAIDVLRRASGPMTFAELLGAISAEGPIPTKNPSKTLRSALGNTSLIVSAGEGQYEYVPRGTTGCIFRQPLRMEEAAEGAIAWERDVAAAIWPASNEHSPTRKDCGPVRFRLDAADEIELDYEWLAPYRFGSKSAEPLWSWLRGLNASAGDGLLVQIVDGQARIVQLTFSPRGRRDEEAIRARNVELADTVEPIVARRPTKSLYFRDTVAELMVRGFYHSPCPPDPLEEVLAADQRFGVDSLVICLPDRIPAFAREPRWFLDGVPVDVPDALARSGASGSEESARPKRQRGRRRKGKEVPARVYELKVTLMGAKPPIWRRIQVPTDITLAGLHEVLQVTMGWYNCHLYQFLLGDVCFGEPNPDYDDWGTSMHDAAATKLENVIAVEKEKLFYEYDFGDGWDHEILLEKILPGDAEVQYPVCLKGKRACPPEDCGGVWGYARLLEVLADLDHEEHDDLLEWAGGRIDPEAFDFDVVNAGLRPMR